VTFTPSGRAGEIEIEAELGPEAIACLSERLSAVTVPPFGGAPMTVGTQWLVH
jgi:hypothetical protein